MLDDVCRGVRRLFAEQQDRHVDARLPEFDPLGDERDAQSLRAARDRRSGDLDRAMPVSIGLHHRPYR